MTMKFESWTCVTGINTIKAILKTQFILTTRILNGGLLKWINEKRGLSTHPHRINMKTFLPQPNPDKIATAEWILKHISDPDVVMLDVRRASEYTGREVRAMRGGRIPGSINIEWRESAQDDQTFKSS